MARTMRAWSSWFAGGESGPTRPMPAWAKALKTDILEGLGTVIDQKIAPITREMHTLRECVGICSGKADAALSEAKAAKHAAVTIKTDIDSRMKKLEDQMASTNA